MEEYLAELEKVTRINPLRLGRPPTEGGLFQHLLEYRDSAGVEFCISIWARDIDDARDRLRRAADGTFKGIVHQVIT
jgi:hypothetical protein